MKLKSLFFFLLVAAAPGLSFADGVGNASAGRNCVNGNVPLDKATLAMNYQAVAQLKSFLDSQVNSGFDGKCQYGAKEFLNRLNTSFMDQKVTTLSNGITSISSTPGRPSLNEMTSSEYIDRVTKLYVEACFPLNSAGDLSARLDVIHALGKAGYLPSK